MVKLYDAETSVPIGEITEGQLQFTSDDQDYWIDIPTLAMLRSGGADEEMIAILAKGLGGRPGYEVRWER